MLQALQVVRGQARFSTLEFEKSSDGCGSCSGKSCGKGFCSSTSFYDYSSRCDFGSEGMVNEFDLEEAQEEASSCKCDADVQGEACELGACAAVSCNEPFGGFCVEGKCQCIDGHSGENCEVAPDIDDFGCYAQHEEATTANLAFILLLLLQDSLSVFLIPSPSSPFLSLSV